MLLLLVLVGATSALILAQRGGAERVDTVSGEVEGSSEPSSTTQAPSSTTQAPSTTDASADSTQTPSSTGQQQQPLTAVERAESLSIAAASNTETTTAAATATTTQPAAATTSPTAPTATTTTPATTTTTPIAPTMPSIVGVNRLAARSTLDALGISYSEERSCFVGDNAIDERSGQRGLPDHFIYRVVTNEAASLL